MSSYLFNLIGGNPFQIPFSNDPYTWSNLSQQYSAQAGNFCFPSTLNDGSCITLTSTAISLISASGTTTWTKAPSAVNSNATAFLLGVWLDNVDSPNDIWGLAYYPSGPTVYLFKIAVSTGVLTAVGSGITIASFGYATYFQRAAMGSGNFSFYYNVTGTGTQYVATINSSTGALVGSAVQVTQNSQPWPANFSNISYVSADGTLLVGQPVQSYNGGGGANGSLGWQLPISKNGHISAVPFGIMNSPPSQMIASNITVSWPTSVIGNVVVSQFLTFYLQSDPTVMRGFPVMLRTTFDAWLKTALAAVQTQ